MERMKKILICIIIATLSFNLVGCNQKKEEPKPAEKQPAKTFVDAYGVVKVNDTRNIALSIPSIASKVHVKDGQRVKKGDVLVTLDIKDYTEQIKKKNLEINSAKLELEKARHDEKELNPLEVEKFKNLIADSTNELSQLYSDLRTKTDYLDNETEPSIQQLKINLENAKSAYELAKNDYDNNANLFITGGLAKTTLDHSKNDMEDKQKNMESIQASIDSKKYALKQEIDQINVRISQKQTAISNYQRDSDKTSLSTYKTVELKQSSISVLEADLKRMQDKLNYSFLNGNQIICDIENGVISGIDCTDGDSLASDKRILGVLDLDGLIVEADVAEEFIKDIKIGANSTIIPTADKSKKYTGKVKRISDKAFKKNGETNVTVEITIDNKDDFIKPEFNIDLKIDINS